MHATLTLSVYNPEYKQIQVFVLKDYPDQASLAGGLAQLGISLSSIPLARRDPVAKVYSPTRGPAGRMVQVHGIDREVHDNYCTGDKSRSVRCPSKPVEDLQVFNTAAEASRHLGVSPNVVGMALDKAKQCKESYAVVRGVALRYIDVD